MPGVRGVAKEVKTEIGAFSFFIANYMIELTVTNTNINTSKFLANNSNTLKR